MRAVRHVFASLPARSLSDYATYWKDLTVTSHADYFRRFLFAFCSVHTIWESNVRGYEALRDLGWLGDDKELRTRLLLSGVGMHNNRTKYISEFATEFWSQPLEYCRLPAEPWWVFRDRIASKILGLGLAKTSFALELSYPTEVEVACLDVHMLRLYGCDQKKANELQYHKYESDWIGRSAKLGAPPYMTRMVYWDKLQGKPDSRYWSHCLEKR